MYWEYKFRVNIEKRDLCEIQFITMYNEQRYRDMYLFYELR